MKLVVAGLGIQGKKRLATAGSDVVATVDPVNREATYRDIRDVPRKDYDAALLCTPDDTKLDLLFYLLGEGKHVLVEKPLFVPDDISLTKLAQAADRTGAVCYTAYNHRFEPHVVRMKDALASGVIGPIYVCRMFYGNGTAHDVRQSPWRDRGVGVLSDLGSHLLDTALYWFGDVRTPLRVWSANRFENRALDHMLFGATGPPVLEMEISLISWRNDFTADIYGETGSLHIRSLCKWGPSTFTRRTRVLPSGRPPEEAVTVVQADPTWELEYAHFKTLCANGGPGSLDNDIRLNALLNGLVRGVDERVLA